MEKNVIQPKKSGSIKFRNINLYNRSTEQKMYRNIEEIFGKKPADPQDALIKKNSDINMEKENKAWTDGQSTCELFEDHSVSIHFW